METLEKSPWRPLTAADVTAPAPGTRQVGSGWLGVFSAKTVAVSSLLGSVPLAAVAWGRHGVVVGAAVYVVEVLWLGGATGWRPRSASRGGLGHESESGFGTGPMAGTRPTTPGAKYRARTIMVQRFANTALRNGTFTWCFAAAVLHQTVADMTIAAVITGLASASGFHLAPARLLDKAQARRRARRSGRPVLSREDQRAIRAGRRNGG